MEIVGLIILLLFLGFSVTLYLAGILVVDRVGLSVELDQKIQLYYNLVAQHGSADQKQEALEAAQRKDLENLQAIVGTDFASN